MHNRIEFSIAKNSCLRGSICSGVFTFEDGFWAVELSAFSDLKNRINTKTHVDSDRFSSFYDKLVKLIEKYKIVAEIYTISEDDYFSSDFDQLFSGSPPSSSVDIKLIGNNERTELKCNSLYISPKKQAEFIDEIYEFIHNFIASF